MRAKVSFLLLYLLTIVNMSAWSAEVSAASDTNKQPVFVDLGLSVFWADRNYGAETPSDYGEYYGWGAPASNVLNDDFPNIKDIRKTSYDVCYVQNPLTRMPSYEELNELMTKCIWTYCQLDGVDGFEVKGPNGNVIFIPAAGGLMKGVVNERGDNAFIWSGENKSYSAKEYASDLHIHSKTYPSRPIFMSHTNKQFGLTVRAVAETRISQYPIVVMINNLEYTLYEDLTAQLNKQNHQLDKDVVIPEKVTYSDQEYLVTMIDNNALSGHSEVFSLRLECDSPCIGGAVFNDMKGLKVIEYNIKTLDRNYNYTNTIWRNPLFVGCDNLEEIIIDKDAEDLIPYFFSYTPNIKSVIIPSSVKSIDTDCFASMPDLESFTLEEGIQLIGNALVSNCPKLTTIYYNCINCKVDDNYLTNKHPSIGDRTPLLVNLYIGDKVESIDKKTFSKCSTFKDIYVQTKNPPVCDETTNFNSNVKKNATLHVPYGTKSIYENAPVWKEFFNIVEMQNFPIVVIINGLEYTLYENLTAQLNVQRHMLESEITIPDYVGYGGSQFLVNMIVEGALRGHNEVKTLNLECKATGVGAYAFAEMKGLTDINYNIETTRDDFNYSRTIWKNFVFKDCINLENLNFGESVVKTIPYFFSGCPGITNMTIPSSIEFLSTDCFTYMHDLAEVEIGEGVKTFDVALFDFCENIHTVRYNCIDCATVENHLTPYYPPFGKNNLSFTTLHIGSKVEKIHKRTFSQCNKLSDIYVYALVPPVCDLNMNFMQDVKQNATLYVPEGQKEVYMNALVWKEFYNIVEFDASGIEDVEYNEVWPVKYYDINGREYDAPQPGFNIMIDSKGKAHKILN